MRKRHVSPITIRELMDKLADIEEKITEIDDKIIEQDLSQKKNWIVSIGFSCIIFGYSVMLASVINYSNIERIIGNLLISAFIVVIMGFLLMIFSNTIVKKLDKILKKK